jgi:hypothetical protein
VMPTMRETMSRMLSSRIAETSKGSREDTASYPNGRLVGILTGRLQARGPGEI